MANADAAFGFRPINAQGGPYNGQTQRCYVPTTASEGPLFIGDVVTLIGSASTDGYPSVKEAAATEAAYGVVASFDADPNNLSLQYRATDTERYCQVVPVRNNFFVAQFDGVSEAGDVGTNTIFVVGAGDTVSGRSTTELSATTVSTTVINEIKVIAFLDQPDNDLTLTNAKAIVQFNEPQLGIRTVGV
jgi:hypothetical protein